MASCTSTRLSRILHPLIKPPWFFGMIAGSIFLSLEAITLVIILYPVLQRKMGRNLLKLQASFYFRIRAKKAELVLPPILIHLCNFLTIFSKSCLMVVQRALKNLAVNPSGPGALSASMRSSDFLISFKLSEAVRFIFSSLETSWGIWSRG